MSFQSEDSEKEKEDFEVEQDDPEYIDPEDQEYEDQERLITQSTQNAWFIIDNIRNKKLVHPEKEKACLFLLDFSEKIFTKLVQPDYLSSQIKKKINDFLMQYAKNSIPPIFEKIQTFPNNKNTENKKRLESFLFQYNCYLTDFENEYFTENDTDEINKNNFVLSYGNYLLSKIQ